MTKVVDQAPLPAVPGSRKEGAGSVWSSIAWFLLFTTVAMALYGGVLDGEFVFDDRKLVVENEELWSGAGFDFRIFRDRSDAEVRTNFRPVRFLSYAIDARLTKLFRGGRHAYGDRGDPDPWFFHFQNIVWHALSAFLLFALVRRLSGPGRPIGAALPVAMLFLVHPVYSECVAYVSGRRDVLFLAFYLLGLLAYVRARTSSEPVQGLRPVGVGTAAVVTVCFILSVLSKEMAATFPVTLVAIELLLARQRGEAIRFPWFLLVLLTLALLIIVGGVLLAAAPGGDAGFWGGSWQAAFWTSARALWRYVALFIFPSPLSVDYSFDVIEPSSGPLEPWTGLLSVVGIVVSIVVAVVAWRRGHPAIAIGIPLLFVLASPVSQIVFPHPERFAERYLYLPSLALFMIAAGTVRAMGRSVVAASSLVALLLIPVSLIATYQRLGDWQTAEGLWESAVRVHPRCARSLYAYANQLKNRGQLALALERASAAVELLAPLEQRDALQQGYFLQAWTLRVTLLSQSSREAMALALREMTDLEAEIDTDGRRLADDPVLLLERMKLETRLDQMDDSRRTAERICALSVPDPIAFEARLFLAGYHEARGDMRTAWRSMESAETFAKTPRQRGRLAYQRGLHFETQSLWKRALDAYREAAEVVGSDGNWVSARYKEAECLERLNEREESSAVLRRILDDRPDHWPSVLALASFDIDAQRYDSAQKGLVRLLAAVPNNPEATRLVKMLALHKARDAGELDGPSNRTRLEALVALARGKLDEGDLEKARAALAKADQLDDGEDQHSLRLELLLTLGEVAAREERWEDAAAAYRRHLQRASTDEQSTAILQYGDCLRRLGKTRSALGELTAYWNAGVRHPRLAKNLGGLAVEERDAKGALTWYRLYLDQDGLPARERAQVEPIVRRLQALVEDGGG